MADVDNEKNTLLDTVSSAVTDEQIGPELTPEEQKARRLATMERAISALHTFHERMGMIERAIAQMLPELLREQPIGTSVDIISDLSKAIDAIGGDSGSAAGIKGRITYNKEVTMPELLDAAKVKTFNTDRYRVTKTTKLMASVNPEAGMHTEGEFAGQPIAWDWLRANGQGSIIKPTVNASSLSAVAKELIENGMELPEDLFRVHTKQSISITKKG